MASPHHEQQNPNLLFDALYCQEDNLEDEEDDEEEGVNGLVVESESTTTQSSPLIPLLLLEQDLFWEDEELVTLFSKEHEAYQMMGKNNLESDSNLLMARQGAVEWMLRANAHYGFSALTAVLCVNYLDRFISSLCFQRDKPWMTQLAAVACLSLAAKVEETQVPLLLDLQVEETKYVFEAKTIQRMELLVLSTLHWKMNPVTPLSFLDHIVRRLGLKTSIHWEFMKMCECLLLSVIADSRSVCYLPSILATSAMLHVINQVELYNPVEYENQLMEILKVDKDKVDDCYQFILETMGNNGLNFNNNNNKSRKRKYASIPNSPNGVMETSIFSYENSNDSWASGGGSTTRTTLFKKNRAEEQQMRLPLITSPR